jgi:uncharacterized protein (TIGR00297 family)
LDVFFTPDLWIIFLLLVGGAILSVWQKKLTWLAAFTGVFVGLLIYFASGVSGLVMLAIFFILGSFATTFNFEKKQRIGVAEKNKGQRKASQVLANAGAAGLFSILALLYPQHRQVFLVAIAGSFSTALADTLSSEFGALYGTKFYKITTLKHDTRGLDGVISVEGTLIGFAGSILIAMVYALANDFNEMMFFIIIGGTVGNLTDSLLGATVERKGYVGNDVVNFLSTLIGAVVCLLLSLI